MTIFKKRKLKNTIANLCLLTISFLPMASWAEEVFGLIQVESPFDHKDTDRRLLVPPSYQDGISTVTIKDNKMVLGNDRYDGTCSVEIDKMAPFPDGRFFSILLDAIGGYDKVNRFLKTKLHTDMKQWTSEYKIKSAKSPECSLFGSIFRGKNELVVYHDSYFYRFIARKGERVKNFKEVSGYLEVDCTKVTVDYLEKNMDRCLYSDELDKASRRGGEFKYICFSKNETNDNTMYPREIYDNLKACQSTKDWKWYDEE